MTNTKINNIIFYSFLLLYATGIIYLCFTLNVWEDEAYTLNTTSHGFLEVIRLSYTFEGQPPAYFLLMALWRTISSDIIFAKFFSILSIGIAAWYFNKLVFEITGNKNNRWMLAIFLINPFTVWAALEIRLYAFMILLSVLAIYYFIKYFKYNSKQALYTFLVIALVGAYTQYFFTLLVASLAFSLLLYKGWKYFFTFCLYLLPVVVLFLPNFTYINAEVHMHQQTTASIPFLQTISDVFRAAQNFLLALQLAPFGRWGRWLIKSIVVISLCFAYYTIYKNRNNKQSDFFKILNTYMLATGILFILYCTVFALKQLTFAGRYLAIVFPLIILLYVLLGQLKPVLHKGIFVSCMFYFAFLVYNYYKIPVKDIDYKNLAGFVQNIESPKEPIVFYSSQLALPFLYYYKGAHDIIPLPNALTFDSNYISNVSDTLVLKTSLLQKVQNASSFLFVSNDYDSIQLNRNMNRPMIDSFLNGHYNQVFDTLYYGRSKTKYLRIRRFAQK
ncbi:MAG TPA: hypothetical protein PK987_06810 [Ferruginibacter sp.]|nr:hypothetical protein [Ferruginibacter sp.]